jgi:hypothetical protein
LTAASRARPRQPGSRTHHEAALLTWVHRAELVWFAYEDAGYKHVPGLLAWRVATLFKSGLWPTPAMAPVELDVDRDHRALACDRSQLAPLERDHALTERLASNVP